MSLLTEELDKVIQDLKDEIKELNDSAQMYGEFCIKCDREGRPVLYFEDFLKLIN